MDLNVLQVVRPARGGIHRHVGRLLRELPGQGVRVSLAAPGEAQGSWGFTEGFPFYEVPLSDRPHPLRDYQAAQMLARAVEQGGANVIHAHGYRAAWIASLAVSKLSGKKPPLLATAHNLFPARPSFLGAFALHAVQNRVARWIGVSEGVRDSLAAAGIPHGQVEVIPNGIDASRYRPAPREETRHGLEIAVDAPVVIVIARLEPAKGVGDALRAFTMLRRAHPDARMIVVGEGPDRDALLDLAHERALGSAVRFLGWREDAADLLSVADACLIPSRSEGQSLVALEAMALGVPVVASEVGGLPEMIRHRETGLLAPPGDAPAMAHALSQLLRNAVLREELAGRAGEEVRSNWDEATMIRRTADLYRQVLGRPRVRPAAPSAAPSSDSLTV